MLMPVTLRGHLVCLEPLTIDHVNDLCVTVLEDRSTYTYTYVPNGQEDTKRYIEIALADFSKGRALPFLVRHLDTGRIVGTTRFLDLEVFSWPPGVASGLSPTDLTPPTVAEIGSTWYAASFQRTGVNTECKLLMLAHAFDSWNTIRVTLKTDARNIRSRSAIQRLGATFEGIRRAHLPASDGSFRDTAYFSIIAEEWPAVRTNLQDRLQKGLKNITE